MKASRFCAWSSAALLALPVTGFAMSDEAETFRLQAFAAASLIKSTEHNFFGDTRSRPDTRFTELGVNAIWQLHDKFQLSGQLLHRRAGNSDEDGLRLDYAQVNWTWLHTGDTRLGLKFGKPKLPYGLYNETRDVPFTRPGILLPQSIYYDTIRDFVLAAPGAYLHGTRVGDFGAVEINLGIVRPSFDSQSFERNFFRDIPGELRGHNSRVASVRWETPTDTTLALYHVDLDSRYKPAGPVLCQTPPPLLCDFPPGTLNLSSWLVSLQQRIDTFTLTAELAMPRLERRDFGPLDGTIKGRSWYLQGEWRFASEWEAMLRYDRQYSDLDRRDDSTKRARDLTVGVRWDATPNLMLRAEYHHIDGTGWLPAAENVLTNAEPRWDMWLLQAAWRF